MVAVRKSTHVKIDKSSLLWMKTVSNWLHIQSKPDDDDDDVNLGIVSFKKFEREQNIY